MTPKITPEIRQAIDEHKGQPVFIVDPDRHETFVLLSNAEFARVRQWLGDVHKGQDWTEEKNERRCDLIDKDIAGTITDHERVELAQLEFEASRHFDDTASPPMEGSLRLHQELLNRRDQQQ